MFLPMNISSKWLFSQFQHENFTFFKGEFQKALPELWGDLHKTTMNF